VSRDDAGAVLPDALAALSDLRARGLTHRWVRHVRSSQAFALSLFAPLSGAGSRRVLAHLGLNVVEVEPVVFEFEDHQDRLAEASPRSQHRTQVDVVLRGTTADGDRVAAFIEVKLSELDFGSCSAFESPDNASRATCSSPGLFGGDPGSCFQLQNHGRGRRHYDAYLPEPTVSGSPSDDGGCLVRGGRNQPMRNLALAHLLVAKGELDGAVYALCAPSAHPTIWRRYQEFRSVFPDTGRVWTAHLPAELVARQHDDGGAAFVRRYAPALTDQALLHLSPDGSALLGVWLQRGGQLESYYPDDQFASLAEQRLTGQDWDVAVDTFPQSAPYLVWWESADCSFSESAADIHHRLMVDLDRNP
jgi:hypothetical protein